MKQSETIQVKTRENKIKKQIPSLINHELTS